MLRSLTLAFLPGGSGLLLILLVLYFVPTAVAVHRAHHQLSAILIINLFLGWTFLGWVIALAMAFTAVEAPQAGPPTQSPDAPPTSLPAARPADALRTD
jgi:hypothetical protein